MPDNGKAERFIQTLLRRMGLRPAVPQLRYARRRPAQVATTTSDPMLASLPDHRSLGSRLRP